MTQELLIKFFNNRCTTAEVDEVILWTKTEALNEENRKWAFEDWKSFSIGDELKDDEKFSLLFDRINYKIDHDHHLSSRKTGLPLFTIWLTRAAAILLIPVLSYLLYTLSENKAETLRYANITVDSVEIVAPIGSRTVVQLSDGSEVYLNYGSKIKYPLIFSNQTREVLLTGEGYFNVVHNPEKPFIVKTKTMNVKALGTSFNILAYPGNNLVETTLISGKLVLEERLFNKQTKNIGVMVPGQHVDYNIKTGQISSTIGNVEKFISWKEGKLVFEDTPITEIAEKLNLMFNVNIEVADDIKDYFYTVTFVDEPLFQILDLMKIASPMTYKAVAREKLPDGTFSKQKVIIRKRK